MNIVTSINEYIIRKSKELDIDIIGFTDGSPFLEAKEILLRRQKENKQTEFEEKDIEKRINPLITLDSCKSIIVIGISYNVENNYDKLGLGLKGRLSKSSWGIDYHKVLNNKLELLIKELKKELDFEYKSFVDTGPLIDRELAKRAGVGYFGKNCSIINDDYGSFIFLGYILTNLKLDLSIKVEEKCGDCDLCIKACPTKALEEPYSLNPKRCISYLTQTKENIPLEFREKMGMKIYGCDTCQNVCPKNKGIMKSNQKEFIPETTKGYMDIEELLFISNKEFKKKYGNMAGSWRGKTILKRNAIITLGNMKKEENLIFLINELKNPNPMIREYASWSISNIYLTMISKIQQDML